MDSQRFQEFINDISLLTNSQVTALDAALYNVKAMLSQTTPDAPTSIQAIDPQDDCDSPNLETITQRNFSKQVHCSYCASEDVIRWGVRKNRQRYRCKSCGGSFTAFTGTPLSGLHYPEKWNQYLSGMSHSLTLRPAAAECSIDLKTSFRWRHRFLSILQDDKADLLEGIIELDETFLRESFKGQRADLPRPARKRGNDPTKARKVPVMVARDRKCHTVDGVLENESATELCRHLNRRISIEGTVCADAHLAHEKLAEILGFEFKELVTSAGQHVLEGKYHIQHVNAYHSHFKRWLGIFRGVATKYLPHYLGWRRRLTEPVPLTLGILVERISNHWCYQPSTAT